MGDCSWALTTTISGIIEDHIQSESGGKEVEEKDKG
jgi:hypothetical protein